MNIAFTEFWYWLIVHLLSHLPLLLFSRLSITSYKNAWSLSSYRNNTTELSPAVLFYTPFSCISEMYFHLLLRKNYVASYCLKKYLLSLLPIAYYSKNVSTFFCSALTDCFVSTTAWSMKLPSLQREICRAQTWRTVLQTLKLLAVHNVATETLLVYFHEKKKKKNVVFWCPPNWNSEIWVEEYSSSFQNKLFIMTFDAS